jgi:hypothetical protein
MGVFEARATSPSPEGATPRREAAILTLLKTFNILLSE